MKEKFKFSRNIFSQSKGKIELEMEVLLAEVAEADPVGKGREEPHALPPPE